MLSIEDFKKEIDGLWREAKRVLAREGELLHRLDIWDAAGKRTVVMGITPARAGEPTAPVIAHALHKAHGVAFVDIAGCWFSRDLRPSADPAREEGIVLTAIFPAHAHREMRTLSFAHDERGDVHFGIEFTETGDKVMGDIAHLLDAQPALYRGERLSDTTRCERCAAVVMKKPPVDEQGRWMVLLEPHGRDMVMPQLCKACMDKAIAAGATVTTATEMLDPNIVIHRPTVVVDDRHPAHSERGH